MIRTVIVDDESYILTELEYSLKKIEDVTLEGAFTDALAAMQFVMGHKVDMMILDIEMPKITGIELAESVKKINWNMQIIFVTGYSKYSLEAFQVNALSYLMKPYTFSELRTAVDKARVMLKGLESGNKEKAVRVQTFGKFEVFYNDKNVVFSSRKAKELLAAIIDGRGGGVTMETVINRLWEERSLDSKVRALYRKTVSRMRETLEGAGCGYILEYYKGQIAVKPGEIDCDYYNFLEGDEKSMAMFWENYLEEYSWAEERNGLLLNHLKKV